MNIKVRTVSKREQSLFRTAAAVTVIDREAIRRSGATNLPDLLRTVPGLQVAQINNDTWAIAARGFNGQFSNKLLVLMDGRTVYDPSFSGVYWDMQDAMLEDIDRIEVIRGASGTIWGANAVNGVINILTKPAKDTQGGLLTAGGGNREQSGAVRFGGTAGESIAYRLFAKHEERNGSDGLSRQGLSDAERLTHGGFRMEAELGKRDSATIQGDVYNGRSDTALRGYAVLPAPLPALTLGTELGGGDILARWNHSFEDGSHLSLQTYFDRLTRVDAVSPELRSTLDFDVRHRFGRGRHEVVWGTGFRHTWDRLSGSPVVQFSRPNQQHSIANFFIQDEVTLLEDRLWFTWGIKAEHNSYTGMETQPNLSLTWSPGSRHCLWFSYAKAARVPSRNDEDIHLNLSVFSTPDGLPGLVQVDGNRELQSEILTSYEIGYRVQPSKSLTFDFTGFRNRYTHLNTLEAAVTPFLEMAPPPHFVVPFTYRNWMSGETYGAEAWMEWKATPRWTLAGGYSWFLSSLSLEAASTDFASLQAFRGNAPRNQVQARSQFNLSRNWEFDVAVYHVGRLATGSIPAYQRLDSRLGWHFREGWEFSLVGQNLLSPRHPEFNQEVQKVLSADVQRTVHGKLTWRF